MEFRTTLVNNSVRKTGSSLHFFDLTKFNPYLYFRTL